MQIWKLWLMAIAAVVASPVFAQEVSLQGRVPEPASGVRETAVTGFALLEHGIWPRAFRSPAEQPKSAGDTAFANRSPKRSYYLPLIIEAEARHGLPTGLLDALIWAESSYNAFAISSAGAAGLAQLMPGTARELGVLNRYDPATSIDGGARYLRKMLDRFGTVHLALAAYNAGPNAVARIGRIPLNGETPTYVSKIIRRWSSSGDY